jgi:hypothetical protein
MASHQLHAPSSNTDLRSGTSVVSDDAAPQINPAADLERIDRWRQTATTCDQMFTQSPSVPGHSTEEEMQRDTAVESIPDSGQDHLIPASDYGISFRSQAEKNLQD